MKKNICIMLASLSLMACAPGANQKENAEFDYTVERFADLEVLRYQVKGFDELSLDQKKWTKEVAILKKKQTKCYLYTRVSTSMQVDGYSLDAQRDKLRKYAAYEDMVIAGEYSDGCSTRSQNLVY